MRFDYNDAETATLFDALAELQAHLEERRERLLDSGLDFSDRRMVAVRTKLAEVERLTAKLGNDLSGYTVEESEGSLATLSSPAEVPGWVLPDADSQAEYRRKYLGQ